MCGYEGILEGGGYPCPGGGGELGGRVRGVFETMSGGGYGSRCDWTSC